MRKQTIILLFVIVIDTVKNNMTRTQSRSTYNSMSEKCLKNSNVFLHKGSNYAWYLNLQR